MALSGRFEKLGGGQGYVWATASATSNFTSCPRTRKSAGSSPRRPRAHSPELPPNPRPPVTRRASPLLVNGIDCGSRLVPVEDPQHQVVQEWTVSSFPLWMQTRPAPPHYRFAVEADGDQPYGLNISNFSAGYQPPMLGDEVQLSRRTEKRVLNYWN